MSKIISTVFNPITKTIDYFFRGGGEFKAMNALGGDGTSYPPPGYIGHIIDVDAAGGMSTVSTTTANTYVDVPGSTMHIDKGTWIVFAHGTLTMSAPNGPGIRDVRIAIRDADSNTEVLRESFSLYLPNNTNTLGVPFAFTRPWGVGGGGINIKLSIKSTDSSAACIAHFYVGDSGIFGDSQDINPKFYALKIG